MADVRALTSSVRVRIAAMATVITAIALGFGGWALVRAVEGTQTAELRRLAERRLDQIAERVEDGRPLDDSADLLGPPLGVVRIVDATTGDVLVALDAFPGQQVVFQAARPALGEQIAEGVEVSGPLAIRLEAISRTVDTPRGPITIVAAAPADEITRSVDAIRRSLLLGLPVVLALVAGVSWIVVGRALQPVEHIREEVEEISASTLHRRVPEPAGRDEIARLAHTMNAMLDRIEAAATRQQQFVSDASHELRSPVAALRTQLEVAIRSDDAALLRDAVATALQEEARLEALLDDLLALAAMDERAGPPRDEVFDVRAVVEADAERRSRAVRAEVPPEPCLVRGSASDVGRAVRNLVDNAERHAEASVEVRVVAGDGVVVLHVDDDGPGIAPADRERVFERFTRLDQARTRAGGGTGLGLALVRAVVTHHRGTVTVDDAPLGGARLTMTLPREAGLAQPTR